MKFNSQFNRCSNRMETGNQVLSFCSHTWATLKELQLGWLSPRVAVLRGDVGLCCRPQLFCSSQRGKNNFTVSAQGIL